jgi:hypothetical protein
MAPDVQYIPSIFFFHGELLVFIQFRHGYKSHIILMCGFNLNTVMISLSKMTVNTNKV